MKSIKLRSRKFYIWMLFCSIVISAFVLITVPMFMCRTTHYEITINGSSGRWRIWKSHDFERIKKQNPNFSSCEARGMIDCFEPISPEGFGDHFSEHIRDLTIAEKIYSNWLDYKASHWGSELPPGYEFSDYILASYDYELDSTGNAEIPTGCYYVRNFTRYPTSSDMYLPGIFLDLQQEGYMIATMPSLSCPNVRVYKTDSVLNHEVSDERVLPEDNLVKEGTISEDEICRCYESCEFPSGHQIEVFLKYGCTYLIMLGSEVYTLTIAPKKSISLP